MLGHGTALGGRYRLEERLRADEAGAWWRAVDQVLERPVAVHVLDPERPNTEDTLDAARRACLADDPRLLRVLDLGAEDDHPFVVSELVPHASLTSLIGDQQLSSERARAVVGEAAQALEAARSRGLHHLRLNPSRLLLARDGGVKVAGIAVDAAAAGLEPEDPVTAARQDSVALVAILYAALTGRWPGEEPFDGLPAAPRRQGGPVPPADLVDGVPNDLDTLCAVTLAGHDDGPHTPGELAEQLAPWGRSARPSPAAGAGAAAANGADDPPHPTRPLPVVTAGAAEVPAEARPEPAAAAAAAAASAASAPAVPPPPAYGPLAWDDEGPPAPFAPATPINRPPQNQTRIAVAVIAVLVIIGLVLAVRSLSELGRGSGGGSTGARSPSASSTGKATTPGHSATSTSPAAPAGAPIPIVGGAALDPQGDNQENDAQVPRAFDGNPATAWQTSTYATQSFGGLKQGVGIAFDLGGDHTVTQVTAVMPGEGGTVELRTAPGMALDGSQVVATGNITGGQVVFKPAKPVKARYLVLWITSLPNDGGKWRASVAEVTVQ